MLCVKFEKTVELLMGNMYASNGFSHTFRFSK